MNGNAEKEKFITKRDFLLIGSILLVALGALLFLKMGQKRGSNIEITIGGVVYGNYSLNEEQQIEIVGDDFVSILHISDGKASMVEADCPDQICVNHKAIHLKNESIVCLPHKVVVKVISSNQNSQEDFDIISK